MSRVLTAITLALVLTACGGGGKDKPPPQQTAGASATAERDANGCAPAEAPQAKAVTLPEPTETLDAKKTYVAQVVTNCGAFQITLDAKHAPKTAASFKYLADNKFYDGTTFHRIVPGFVIQGGDPLGNGTGGPGYSVVETPPKALKYSEGVVAMAKAGNEAPGTSGSQFFVVTGADAAQLPPAYALLGQLTSGQPVVKKIGAIITDPRTDAPDAPVVIESIRVIER